MCAKSDTAIRGRIVAKTLHGQHKRYMTHCKNAIPHSRQPCRKAILPSVINPFFSIMARSMLTSLVNVTARVMSNNENARSKIMPRGNGTGPMGIGPMTGRGAGFCAGFDAPGYAARGGNGGNGGGAGRRCGGGFRRFGGLGFGAPATASAAATEPDREALQRRLDALTAQLDAIKTSLARNNETK
jgi:hypothetical protein